MIASITPIRASSRTMAAVMNSGLGALRALTKKRASSGVYGHGGEESQRITSQFANSAWSCSASRSRGARKRSRRIRISICVWRTVIVDPSGRRALISISAPIVLLSLRHTLHWAPALERAPDAAFEPEAIDRHGRAERANAAEPDTGPLEAALLEHAP